MRIAVVGTGSVGGYFGGRLAQVGEDVTFLARGDHLHALKESGLRVDSVDGDIVIHPVQVTDTATLIGPVDVVLLAVKGWQVTEAIATMQPLIGDATVVIPLLNGVEAPDQLASAFAKKHVAGGLCRLFGAVVAPGHFRNGMPQPFIMFGMLDNAPSDHLDHLRQAFVHAGVQVEIATNMRVALWEKLLFVGPFGGVGAVSHAPIGVIRALPETRALLAEAMTEIVQVAQAHGVTLAADAMTRALAWIDGAPEQATASMQRDIIAGRPSELESQIGVVVRLARAVGGEVPCHTCLYASLLPQERRARGEVAFTG